MNRIREERVNAVHIYQHDFTREVDCVVTALHKARINTVVHVWVLKQNLISWHLDEKYGPKISIVLGCILSGRRIIMIVTVVVANRWENWDAGYVLCNHLDDLLHRVKHEVPVGIGGRRVILTEAVSN